MRAKIALGAARGIAYLHEDCKLIKLYFPFKIIEYIEICPLLVFVIKLSSLASSFFLSLGSHHILPFDEIQIIF